MTAPTGAVLDQATVPATPSGYQQLLRLAHRHAGRRVWAIEATGGYGAGLTRFLHAYAEQVVELDRPERATRRHGAKSDALDAIRAAREALARERLAQPRAAGQRAAFSVRLAARRSAVQATTTPNASSTPWSSPLPTPSVSGWVVLGRPAWSPPVGGFDCGRPGTPRPWRPRRVCGLWPAASSS